MQMSFAQAHALLQTPADTDEQCMVVGVADHLATYLGAGQRDIFVNDAMIQSIKNKKNTLQRSFINRYFNNLLLRFRAKSTVRVNDQMFYLIDDGHIDDWFKLFREIIIPFLKENNVFNVVYGS